MTYRGRLIFPFNAQIYRLDIAATSQDPDGAGPLESGYDVDFRETVIVPETGKQLGTDARQEMAPIMIECQVEPDTIGAMQQLFSGNVPTSDIALVFHFAQLESMSLVDAEGDALLKVGDRLGGIYSLAGEKVMGVPTPPGLYMTEVRPIGFGLNFSSPQRNLLLVKFDDREQGVRS